MNNRHRILLVCFPGQGHINPTLQFAKRLHRLGLNVTFLTAFSALNRMSPPSPRLPGLDFVGFSTDYDGGVNQPFDFIHLMSQIRLQGSKKISELLSSAAADGEGRPFSHVVYATLLPWVAAVARDFHVPSTLLWIQPAAIFLVYYYYFNGYEQELKTISGSSSSLSVQLPGLPELCKNDLPSFIVPNDAYDFILQLFREHFRILETGQPTNVLMNTCETLETEAIKAIARFNFNLIPIGPMIPTAFLDGHDESDSEYPSDKSFGGDMFTEKNRDYMEWLNSKAKGSVVYVSFGSYFPLSVAQIKEISKGLLITRRPFLWVIRDPQKDENFELELKKLGMIVGWCSQMEVLSHPCLGCFVSHCGWNSTLESLSCGVPIVGFPQWSDQTMNAKMIEDVWRVGVRVERGEDGILKGEELKKCIEMVMNVGEDDERGEEMRKNADKWRVMIHEDGKHGGSSHQNVLHFCNEI